MCFGEFPAVRKWFSGLGGEPRARPVAWREGLQGSSVAGGADLGIDLRFGAVIRVHSGEVMIPFNSSRAVRVPSHSLGYIHKPRC